MERERKMPHIIVFNTRGLLRQVSLTPRDDNGIGTRYLVRPGPKTAAYVTNVIARPTLGNLGRSRYPHSTT